MSHLHIPDGVLPLWIVLAGWLVAGGLLLLALRRLSGAEVARRLPLLGVMTTFMVVVQSIAVPPLGIHVNLTVLSGIMLGPALGLLAAFMVNLVLALFGHGGITVVGLNTLVFGSEMALGFGLFRLLRRVWPGSGAVGVVAAGATLAGLLAGALLVVGIVAASAINPGWQVPHGPAQVVLPNPFGEAPVVIDLPGREDQELPAEVEIGRFAGLVLLLGLIGWPIEAALTGLIVAYIAAVRPDLVPTVGPPSPTRSGAGGVR